MRLYAGAMEITKKPGPGRPRSDASREAILDAAYWQTKERGYPAVTAASIAEAAGAGKQTLYRWWPSKAAVILDAFAQKGRERINRPQEAAIRAGDLAGFLCAAIAAILANSSTLRHLLAEAQADPALRAPLREQLVEPQRAALRRILDGRIPDASRREMVVAAIDGAVWSRLLLDEPLDDEFAALLATLAPADEGETRG
jgi:AcrR family transcriptional regulator